jgi:hypothetical protein
MTDFGPDWYERIEDPARRTSAELLVRLDLCRWYTARSLAHEMVRFVREHPRVSVGPEQDARPEDVSLPLAPWDRRAAMAGMTWARLGEVVRVMGERGWRLDMLCEREKALQDFDGFPAWLASFHEVGGAGWECSYGTTGPDAVAKAALEALQAADPAPTAPHGATESEL